MVDNRTGANSNIGAEAVAHAPADGYTLCVYTVANTVNASLYEKLGYDPLKDFEPIGLIARVPNLLVVNPALPAKNVAEFVKLAQAPAGLTCASSGSGSTIHLSGELFKIVAKANLLHVPYRGSAPALTDLMGGQVQAMCDNTPSVLPHVKAGKLRALALTSAQRSPLLVVADADGMALLGDAPGTRIQVFGVPDDKWGEAVQAAVQLRPGLQATEAELIAFVRERLGPVQTPKHIHFHASLPRSPVGKVLKAAVRELALASSN